MSIVNLPYGKGSIRLDEKILPHSCVLESGIGEYIPQLSENQMVEEALNNPIGCDLLCNTVKGKRRITIVASDHTRPVPSKIIMPLLLREIRKGNPQADITILIATGCHRSTTEAELRQKFGDEIADNEKIVIHDCDDETMLTDIGYLPSGGKCIVNKLVCDTDLVVTEGFIEPHFFAGFSGGRKSILPGVSSRKTVLANHCGGFISDTGAVTGNLDENPIHRDMLWAAAHAAPLWILNVVLDPEKKIIAAFAGDCEKAHRKGCEFLSDKCRVFAHESDIVITTNGGYPLDQNLYQSVKGMTAAEAVVHSGGVIIMAAECTDGIGGDWFEKALLNIEFPEKTYLEYSRRKPEETVPDQWQVQILLRVMIKAKIILVSSLPDEKVRKLHLIPAHSAEEALKLARQTIGKENPTITVIRDGVSVIANKY